MSPSTAPPFCSLTRSARIVPLTRPQTVTSCATTLPSTCAPSLIRRSEARNSPSIRPKICAVPLHSTLPTIDISEPMQEAAPGFVVALSCGWTALNMTSSALFSFSGALLLKLLNMSTSPFSGTPRHRAPYRRYHVWSDAALKNSPHGQFVHMKGKWPYPTGDYLVGPPRASVTKGHPAEPLDR